VARSPAADPLGTIVLALGITHHTGVRLAEVGFLLVIFAGVWLFVAQAQQSRLGRARGGIAGLALVAAGVLLIVAAHWGHFG
jgi:uncharacterized membrane protein